MLNNWHKKEKPFAGFAGFGGGATGLGFGGSSADGHSATGGIISDYTQGADTWRAHIFHSPGTFQVTSVGSIEDTIEYLVVGGGGGGGANTPGGSYHGAGGGGGAGGLRTNVPGVVTGDNTPLTGSPFTVSAQSYPVVVGRGGSGSNGSNNSANQNGGNSSFSTIIGYGGGYGSNNGTAGQNANPGGSGGGGGREFNTAGTSSPVTSPIQGYPGGTGQNVGSGRGTGGGGAGGAGQPYSPTTNGGLGVQVLIAGPQSSGAAGYPGPNGQGGWFAGGGGGGGSGNTHPAGSGGGGGPTASPFAGGGYGANAIDDRNDGSGWPAKALSGGGGGGGASMVSTPDYTFGAQGGSGIVIVRYRIGSSQTQNAKATGGAISFYNGKTIHTFLSPGSFENTSGSPLAIEYVAVAGGGAGQNDAGGGGGAGGVLTNIPGMMPGVTPISDVQTGAPNALAVTIGQGGMGRRVYNNKVSSTRNSGKDTTIVGTGINLSAIGGGAASATNAPGEPGYSGLDGGSGGSARVGRTPALAGQGVSGQGFPGAGPSASGGGGGAGAAGRNSPGANPEGHGGIGVQLPATFQNPASTVGAPGPGGTRFWIAGGGGGGYYEGVGGAWNGSSLEPGGPFAGAGGGGTGGNPGGDGMDGTGGGGGGASTQNPAEYGGSGGSGIVLIAYPT